MEAVLEVGELVAELEICRMQRSQLLARVTAKDAEFAKERMAWKRREAALQAQIKELQR